MELLTPHTAKTKPVHNTDSEETMNIMTGNQQERYIIETNERKKDGKDEKKEVNNVIENCERHSHADKTPSEKDRLAIEQNVFESTGEDNKSLEEEPFIQMEEKQQVSEDSLEGTRNVLQESANDDVDLIARDMLSFAWQIARGMVSDEQSI